jgi:hypothetical protein
MAVGRTILVSVLVSVAGLAGCGGDGSPFKFDSVDPDPLLPGVPSGAFSTISSIPADGVVDMNDSLARTILLVPDGPATGVEVTGNPVTLEDEVYRLRFDDAAKPEAFQRRPYGPTLDSDRADTSISAFPGDPRFFRIARPENGGTTLVDLPDPGAFGLDHMLFGRWLDAAPFFTDADQMGAAVFGKATTPSDMPTAGLATYTAAAIGVVLPGDGTTLDVSADLTLTADFAGRTLELDAAAPRDLATGATIDGLAVLGTATIDGADFAGTAATTNGWSGPLEGRFFGPAAVEAGGFLDLSGVARERYIAAFGARL